MDFFLRIFSRFILISSTRALGSSFETKIRSQIEKKPCYRNISQITIRPGLVVICEIAQLRYFAISLFRNFANYNKPFWINRRSSFDELIEVSHFMTMVISPSVSSLPWKDFNTISSLSWYSTPFFKPIYSKFYIRIATFREKYKQMQMKILGQQNINFIIGIARI